MLIHFSQEQVDSLRRQVRILGCRALHIEWPPKDRLPVIVIDVSWIEGCSSLKSDSVSILGEFRAGELDGRD